MYISRNAYITVKDGDRGGNLGTQSWSGWSCKKDKNKPQKHKQPQLSSSNLLVLRQIKKRFWQSVGSFCKGPFKVLLTFLLQILTPVTVLQPDCPWHPPSPFLRTNSSSQSASVQLCPLASPSGLVPEKFLQQQDQSNQQHAAARVYIRIWTETLRWFACVREEHPSRCLKNKIQQKQMKTKQGKTVGHKMKKVWDWVWLSVCSYPDPLSINDPAWQRNSPRLWSEDFKACVCERVSACKSVNWKCIFVCVSTECLFTSSELSQETFNALKKIYIYAVYILSWATSWESPPPWLKKIPELKTAEV